MGLALDSLEDTFSFLRKYPKTILLALAISIPSSLFDFVLSPILAVGLAAGLSINLSSILVAIILFVALCLVFTIGIGAYPIMVHQAIRRDKVEIKEAVKASLGKFFKILATLLITSLIIMLILSPILPHFYPIFLIYTISPLEVASFVISIALVVIVIIVTVYVALRLFLVFPILILEDKKPLESMKLSWRRTKGNTTSILILILLVGLIVGIISLPVDFLGVVFGIFDMNYISLILGILSSTIGMAISLPATTIYYFNLQSKAS